MILVTGDVVLDHNVYMGKRATPDSDTEPSTRHGSEPGGAMLSYGLLKALAASAGSSATRVPIEFGLQAVTAAKLQHWPSRFRVGALWEVRTALDPKQRKVWRLERHLGYGEWDFEPYPAKPRADHAGLRPRVLVIDDGGLGFRVETAKPCWPAVLESPDAADAPEWIVLKMSRPLAVGDLFRRLSEHWRERLVVVVSADDLRREDARVSRGLSWESTVDDIVDAARSNTVMRRLRSCRHLIVTMRGDAALWMANAATEEATCRLVYDRECGEGEWEEKHPECRAFGYLSAVTTSLAWHLHAHDPKAEVDLGGALSAGLSTSRFLREHGHGPVGSTPGFPFKEAAAHLLNGTPRGLYASSAVPGPAEAAIAERAGTPRWSILDRSVDRRVCPGPLFGPAQCVALYGPGALTDVPRARFGDLVVLDRDEIESLRSLRQLMLRYQRDPAQKVPLSLGVFGAPGCGKSYGVTQIAAGVFGEKNPIRTFNLSQLRGPEDLYGAYHQVRDLVLGGATPVVFWDEFDSGEYRWLQYLLAPMQDGTFQEGQLSHSIGRCVFVFAGGTSYDYAHFGPPEAPATDEERRARKAFVMAKGPDFKSRLAGYLDVLGPNPRFRFDEVAARTGVSPWRDDPNDGSYPIRRALLLRSKLKLEADQPLVIDRGVLSALLEVGHFRHGARSMEKLVLHTRSGGDPTLRRAHLPPDDLLALHVDDVKRFHAIVRRSSGHHDLAERLAPSFHQSWYDHLPASERSNVNYVPYEQLSPEGRAANVAAVYRMVTALELAGFVLERGEAKDEDVASQVEFLAEPARLEFLAEQEHLGWMEQKRSEGWTYGTPRNDVRRLHPLMIPYAQLPEGQKEKDRRTILSYPGFAQAQGFRLVAIRRA